MHLRKTTCVIQTPKDEGTGAQGREVSGLLLSGPEAGLLTRNLFPILHHTLAERKRKGEPWEMTGKVEGVEQNSGQAGPSLFCIITRTHLSEVCVIRLYCNNRSIWVPCSIQYAIIHSEVK